MPITKKILFVTHYSEMYGANQSMCTLIVNLKNKYDIVPFVLLTREGSICDFLSRNDIPYLISHFYWWVNPNKGLYQYLLNLRKQIVNIIRLPKILKALEGQNFDLVCSNSVTINIGVFLSKKLKCSHLWFIRETLQAYGFKFSLNKLLVKHIFTKNRNTFVVISDFIEKSYMQLLPDMRVVKVYNGISLNDIVITKKESITTLNLCMVGVLTEQKNHMDALMAIQYLKEKKGITNVCLHIIGQGDGIYLNVMNQYINEFSLQNVVVFHGHKSSLCVEEILKNMHVGLMCSRDEAFGRVSVEYMLHGMPVIASVSGANYEIVKEGVCGFLYEIYNPKDLADKIFHFIEHPELLNSIGISACNYAKENFSSEKNAREVYQVIKSILNQN